MDLGELQDQWLSGVFDRLREFVALQLESKLVVLGLTALSSNHK